MEKLIEEHGLLSGTENVITEEQIEHVYGVCGRKLKFIEQIELLSRKIYAYYKGLGAIDELRDMKIDGVSGGVSGKEGTYHSAWTFLSWKKCLAAVSGFLSGRKRWSGFPEIFADIISREKFHERKDISFMRWQIMPEL